MQNINLNKVLPAVTFADATGALAVAQAIKQGGINVMEVTLRTEAAIDAIKMISSQLPGMSIGAGTVLTIEQLHKAIQAGAQFGLAPGFNPTVVKEAIRLGFPFIPGVMTPSEIEIALETGSTILKLFPAAQVGGLDFLKSLDGPFGHTGVKFIPMGGVNLQNMNDYLSLKNVISVGGSWIAPQRLIAANDYESIKINTVEAMGIITRRSESEIKN